MTKQISRRDLLKAVIVGSGGFVATSFIPEKWLKPVVKSGVLPVHAQASTPDHNFVKGFVDIIESDDNELILERAYALVSSTPFTDVVVKQTGNFKLASPVGKPIDGFIPVEGEKVSLFIRLKGIIDGEEVYPFDYIFISTKETDENGFVEWNNNDLMEDPKGSGDKISILFKFEILGDSDEVEYVLFDGEIPET